MLPLLAFMASCTGIKYMTIETREPAKVSLPNTIRSVVVVDNTVKQPSDIGHTAQLRGHSDQQKLKVTSDSISLFYTEALVQFLTEEEHFDQVKLYERNVRGTDDFFAERMLDPAVMNDIRQEMNVDAVISLDKLINTTHFDEHFHQEGYQYGVLSGNIQSVLRVYVPSLHGSIPTVRYADSLRWEGYDIQDGRAIAEFIVPSRRDAMKALVVQAADKMTATLAPHWVAQDRWYYTLNAPLMKQGQRYAEKLQWKQAAEAWESYYNQARRTHEQAMSASNIALAYDMLEQWDLAKEWIDISQHLFYQITTAGSLDRKRVDLFKKEIERRSALAAAVEM